MKLVLVTGATRGLGLAITERLAASGKYRVIGTGRTLSNGLKSLMQKDDMEDRIVYRQLDLNDTDGIHDFIIGLTKAFGPLYGLVNNAALGHDGILATMHEKEIAELIRVNIQAPILLSKYASRSMLTRLEGRIIQISSIIATTGFKGLSVYAASKASLVGLTRSLARELGKGGITVNAVLPGYMETDMTTGLEGEKLNSIRRRTPSGKLADVKDVAAAVCFLMSEEATAITGTTLTIDAGSTA